MDEFISNLVASATTAMAMFWSAIPRLIAFLVILIVGWLISSALASAVAGLLRRVRFNDMAERSGVSGFIRNMGLRTDASGVMANITKWFVRLIVLLVAFDALGLPAVSQVLQEFLLWIPNLVVALVILVVAGMAANALANIVRGATAQAELGNPETFATITKVAIWAFGIVVAVNQIGVASTLVNTLFMGIVAALALALGLAFGLGGRDTAGRMVDSWYRKGQEAAPRLQQAAAAAEQQGQRQMEEGNGGTARRTTTVVGTPRDRI